MESAHQVRLRSLLESQPAEHTSHLPFQQHSHTRPLQTAATAGLGGSAHRETTPSGSCLPALDINSSTYMQSSPRQLVSDMVVARLVVLELFKLLVVVPALPVLLRSVGCGSMLIRVEAQVPEDAPPNQLFVWVHRHA